MSAQQEGMTSRTEVLKASPPMFESRWLDACSRVHPSVPVILFGPAIEDSVNGKSVLQASLVRTALFVAVALYAWGTIYALELWRNTRLRRRAFLTRSFTEN